MAFIIGALWNWAAGIQFFFWHDTFLPVSTWTPLNYPAIMQLAMSLVFVFGIGYYWVSKDLSKNHDIVKLGIIV